MPVVYVLNFSDDPYINIIFLCTMVNRLFFLPRDPNYILTEPQMPKTVFKSLQRQQRNQTFKYSCNPVVYTDCTGQFNTKYAVICGKTSTDWTSFIPIFDTGFDHHSIFNNYRYFYRLLCILKKNGITKTDGKRNFEICHCKMSRVIRKAVFAYLKNKGAD